MQQRIYKLACVAGLALCTAPPAFAEKPAHTSAASGPAHAFHADICADDLAAHIRILSSDMFGGRAPGTPDARRTTAYLKQQFKRLGLQPGNGKRYFQSVPMVETRVLPGARMTLRVRGQTITPAYGSQMVVGTRSEGSPIDIQGSPLVFVGYGVNAPEYGWNDYANLDVRGKTVIVLVNDPGFIRKDPALFKGKAMTYYGRWTYKYEEAARQGAAGALLVHEREAAAYGWEVIQNGWTRPAFDLPAQEDPDPRLRYQGWIQAGVAKELFAAAGLDFERMRLTADQRGFKAVALPGEASVSFSTTVRKSRSNNVVALLPGAQRPDEAVIYMAHWDHLGRSPAVNPGDGIFNGAVDNASGVAGVLEIAERFARQKRRPERSLLFLLPTLEESGLLGSRYFANHPTVPLKNLVAAINLDSIALHGRAKDVAIIGFGQSDLDQRLTRLAQQQDRATVAEPTPEAGYYFRSDHFNFARKGVPSLYARAGFNLRRGGVAAGEAAAAEYLVHRYHQPADEFNPDWDYSGALEDLELLYLLGQELANTQQRPQWHHDSEFRAADRARRGTDSP